MNDAGSEVEILDAGLVELRDATESRAEEFFRFIDGVASEGELFLSWLGVNGLTIPGTGFEGGG